MKSLNEMIGKEYIVHWLYVNGYGRLCGQTITVVGITPKKFANIIINLPDGKKINKRVKLYNFGDDGFMINSLGRDVEIQCYHDI